MVENVDFVVVGGGIAGAAAAYELAASGSVVLFEREPVAAWSLLTLAVWNTTITQVVWFLGLAAAPDITRASYLFFLKPVIAAGLAIFVLAQYPSALQVGAILVVTSSVFVEVFWERLRGTFARTA